MPRRKLLYSSEARQALLEIGAYNEQTYGREHARAYLRFLRNEIRSLLEYPAKGTILLDRQELRFLVVRKNSRGHGHVVVYRISENYINVIRIYHSSQDWQSNHQDT